MCSLAFAALFAFAPAALAHDPFTTKITWNREISRMIYKRCSSCHRDGGVAMSLLTYDEARPWAKAMRDQAVTRSMPPWGAVKGVGNFQNDTSLTEVEIQMLVAWVEGGAPKGDNDLLAPKPPPTPKARPVAKPARTLAVTSESHLAKPETIYGVRPASLDGGASMLVDACFPDGRVEHLIWLRDYRKEWTRDYRFRTPLKVPAGTTVRVKTAAPAQALLLLN